MKQGENMDKKELLGRRIGELRKRKGISQEQLAELINVEPATISNIENGKNYPSMMNLERIIRALDSNFLEVFDYEHKAPVETLIAHINKILENHPEKVEELYKIAKAITK